jgi:enolase
MYLIGGVRGFSVFGSKARPLTGCEIKTPFGVFVSSASSEEKFFSNEPIELIDGGEAFLGKGVNNSVRTINEIFSVAIRGLDSRKQDLVDDALLKEDSNKDFSKVGANTIFAVSSAVAKAGAIGSRKEVYEHISSLIGGIPRIPMPLISVITNNACSQKVGFLEYGLVPKGFTTFEDAFNASIEVINLLQKNLAKKGFIICENGISSSAFQKVEEPLDELLKALEGSNFEKNFGLYINCSAQNFSEKNGVGEIIYSLEGKKVNSTQLLKEYEALTQSYPLDIIFDPFAPEKIQDWVALTSSIGKKCLIVGNSISLSDKVFTTNALQAKAVNSISLKPAQAVTVTNAVDCVKAVRENNGLLVVSERAIESCDYFISDFAVGASAEYVKLGFPYFGERLAKYNRILKIEHEFKLKYAGNTSTI